MLELIAIAPRDGWAFVRDNGKIVLARPPYRTRAVADSDTAEAAIANHGFETAHGAFPDWASVVAHLRNKIIDTNRRESASPPPADTAARVLHAAPVPIIEGVLLRIEDELLPTNREGARRVLLELNRAKAVRESEVLTRRVSDLLERATAPLVPPMVESNAEVFPYAQRLGPGLERARAAVAGSGQVLRFGQPA